MLTSPLPSPRPHSGLAIHLLQSLGSKLFSATLLPVGPTPRVPHENYNLLLRAYIVHLPPPPHPLFHRRSALSKSRSARNSSEDLPRHLPSVSGTHSPGYSACPSGPSFPSTSRAFPHTVWVFPHIFAHWTLSSLRPDLRSSSSGNPSLASLDSASPCGRQNNTTPQRCPHPRLGL